MIDLWRFSVSEDALYIQALHIQCRVNNHAAPSLYSIVVMTTSVVGMMRMGNIVPRSEFEPTSLAIQASVLTITPPRRRSTAPCLRGDCRLLVLHYVYTTRCVYYTRRVTYAHCFSYTSCVYYAEYIVHVMFTMHVTFTIEAANKRGCIYYTYCFNDTGCVNYTYCFSYTDCVNYTGNVTYPSVLTMQVALTIQAL